jgi:NAD(P)H-dependent flavin oxidoreductase YrpB (nitropropane dioxygenase family)
MQTEIMKWFGLEAPVFAFSHWPDVVAAVTRNGGMGTFGTTRIPYEQIRHHMEWLARECPDGPIGFDVVFPSKAPHKFEDMSPGEVQEAIPREYFDFADDILRRAGVAPPTEDERTEEIRTYVNARLRTHKQSEARLDIAFQYPNVKMIVSALGVPPQAQIDRAHDLGMKVAALVGHPKHVPHQLAAGVDILISAGYEAGGHTGDIAGMVLTPQVVDAAGPDVPVLHAGGIFKGRQIAAALALGAQGVWTGSVWLGTSESETTPLEKRMMFEATSGDTVRSKARSGKPVRHLNTGFVREWERPGSPGPLPTPLQGVVSNLIVSRAEKLQNEALISQPCGQGVGMLKSESDVRKTMYAFVMEFGETMERLEALFHDQD